MKPKKGRSSKKSSNTLSPKINIGGFAIIYLILMGAFFLLIGLYPIQDVIDLNGIYTKGVIITTSAALEAKGTPCTYKGSIIQLPSIALDVQFGCNGLEAVMIYSVAVIAFPTPWKKRVIGIITGFLIIQILVSSVSILNDIAQPIPFLENTSRITAKYTNAVSILI